jgi:hypothetical protein
MATYDDLINELVEVVKESFHKIFNKEDKVAKFLKHNWLGSKWRATKGVFLIFKDCFRKVRNILALAIAEHRHDDHEQGNKKEIVKLKKEMSHDDIEKATRGW